VFLFNEVRNGGKLLSMHTLNSHERRQVAVEAVCDERTVRCWELGKQLRPTSRLRIERALERLGLTPSNDSSPPLRAA
jgi:hypothetical protein